MTNRESVDSNAIESDGIRIEIWEPDLIVIPRPENTNNVGIPLQINVLITNNTPTPFPFVNHLLMLEIAGADAQALHLTRLIDRQLTTSPYQGISIPPKKAIVRFLIAKISKANNGFEFQASIYNSPEQQIKPDSSWSFKSLKLGTYQLRFTYINPREEFSFKDVTYRSLTDKPDLLFEDLWMGMVSAPFVEFHLVEC